MENNYIILFMCLLIMLSYIFNILSKYTKVPSVILLLATGIGLKQLALQYNFSLEGINNYVQILGTIGLIMIVLEAALDLHLTRDKIPMIRNSFLSSIAILALSVIGITLLLENLLMQPFINSLVYAIPLSIMSSSIVIPSVTHLEEFKKEFLVYEASFSDIIGILIFNFFTAQHVLNAGAVLSFMGSILVGIIISVVFSFLLVYMLSKIKISVKFFLIFSILIALYVSGKMLHLPSLIIIMMFGLLINNWHLLSQQKFLRLKIFDHEEVGRINTQLTSITAESAFLIRTFFFVAFGYSINLADMMHTDVIVAGSLIVAILLVARLVLLGLFLKSSIFPEVLMVPRGLITILLFYLIPDSMKIGAFNEGILSFVVIVTSILMMIGLLLYREKIEEGGKGFVEEVN